MVEFANKNKLSFIATNVPRRYASMVYKKGIEQLDSLSETAKSYIAPLPIKIDLEVGCYKKMLEALTTVQHLSRNLVPKQRRSSQLELIKNYRQSPTFAPNTTIDYAKQVRNRHLGLEWHLTQ